MSQRIPLHQKRRVFVDIETSGLGQKPNGEIDYDLHEILEITIMDQEGHILLDTKVRPVQIETAHPKALEINGYSEAAWADAPTLEDLAPQIVTLLTNVVIVGHNLPGFDYPRLKHWLSRYTDTTKMSFQVVDTMTLVEEHLVPMGLHSLSLKAACDFVGVPLENAHRSAVDVEATRRLYLALRRAGWWKRLGWYLRNRGKR